MTMDLQPYIHSSLPRMLQCNSTQTHTHKRKAETEAAEAEEKSEITWKTEREISSNTCSKTDYIHVRARRGQATDNHSLAERARREKISKKMKCLQDLVPGCNKITGKAGMLDEIINYVQSLQKQVEFLSMKLAAINPRHDLNMDNKEIPAYLPTATAIQFEDTNSMDPCCISMTGWESDWQSLVFKFNAGFH